MSTTIDKHIGEGKGIEVYAALAYDSSDKYGGYQIKDVMHNTTYKTYYYDTAAYIYATASGALNLTATTVTVTGNLVVTGSLTYGATAVPVATGYMGTVTVGIDGTGYDVTFYGATSAKYFLWDESADGVVLVGSFTETGNMAVTGTFTLTGAPTITGNTAITGTFGVTGTTTFTGAVNVGVDATGYDVTFYGETTGYYWKWDQNGDTNGGVVLVGTFTQTGASTITGAITVTGNETLTGDLTLVGALAQTGNTAIVGTLTVGVDATGHDVKFYGETTGYYWLWDQNGDTNGGMVMVGTMAVTGATTITGAVGITGDVTMATTSKINFYGTSSYINASADGAMVVAATTLGITAATTHTGALTMATTSKIQFTDANVYMQATSSTAGKIAATTLLIVAATTLTGALTVGVDDTGHDVKLFGATSGSYLLWDESDDRLEFVAAKMELGTSASPTAVLYNGTQVLQIYTTCGSTTDTGFSQQIIKNVMTGAGQSVEGFGVTLESNVKLGTYANAMCVRADWQTNGGVAGLGSVICAEMVMGAAATDGTFGIVEFEVSCPASWTGTGPVSFLYMNTYGDTKANFDDYGYLLTLTGVTAGAAHIWQTGSTLPSTVGGSLRIMVGATPYFIPVYTSVVTA